MPATKKRHSEDVPCAACGAALHVPANTGDAAIVRCEICQSTIGTWGEVKADARKRREDSRLRVAHPR